MWQSPPTLMLWLISQWSSFFSLESTYFCLIGKTPLEFGEPPRLTSLRRCCITVQVFAQTCCSPHKVQRLEEGKKNKFMTADQLITHWFIQCFLTKVRIHENFLGNLQFSYWKRPWVVLDVFYYSCFQQFPVHFFHLCWGGNIFNNFQKLRDRDISHKESENLSPKKNVSRPIFKWGK